MSSRRPLRYWILLAIPPILIGSSWRLSLHAKPLQGPQSTQSAQKTSRPGGEPVIPSTGQTVDTRKAVDVVRAEVDGGEADSLTGPTPSRFMVQDSDDSLIDDQPYRIVVPTGLTDPVIPGWNPMTVGKVALGKQLFYDPRLSLDSTVSCASCHDPARGWTDQRVASIGIDHQLGSRNSPTILNTAFGQTMFLDGRAPSLEGQALGPIQNKIEMGDQSYRQIIERLRTIPGYQTQFRKVFGTEVTLDALAKAIACFERTALSGNSRYDKYAWTEGRDEDDPATYQDLTLEEKRGMVLFGLSMLREDPDNAKFDAKKLLNRANCTACHTGRTFSDELFHNLGVGYDSARADFKDLGRWVVAPIGTKSRAQRGAFKTPTVRDIARTTPYMHDGSEPTLESVVEFYNKGGVRNPALDSKIAPLNLTTAEKADLVAFLRTLTGKEILVGVPTLPLGADGKSPDPRAALNHPGTMRQATHPSPAVSTGSHQVAGSK